MIPCHVARFAWVVASVVKASPSIARPASSKSVLARREAVVLGKVWPSPTAKTPTSRPLEEYCVLTSRLLKRVGLFETMVLEHIAKHRVSPYIEEMASLFLETIGRMPDPLLAAVARFELAFIRTKKGDKKTYSIQWPQEPYSVMTSLLGLNPGVGEIRNGDYRTIVSSRLHHGFVVQE